MSDDITTPATEELAASGIDHEVVRTRPARSVEESAELQGIPVEQLVKTLVVRRGDDDFLFVLVPGPRQIDWRKLRDHLGVSRLSLPDLDEAQEVTGYERGAITPFGSLRRWPVIVDASIEGRIALGGGARGTNLHLDVADVVRHLDAQVADVTRGD